MSLKKALAKLSIHTHGDLSDSESTPSTPAGPYGGSRSPRNSGTFSPRASRTWGISSSPRTSGTFSRKDLLHDDINRKHAHSPVRAIKEKLHIGGDSDTSDDTPFNRDGEHMSKNQARKAEHQAVKEQSKREQEERENELHRRRQEMEERAKKEEPPEVRARYGDVPPNSYAADRPHVVRTDLLQLTDADLGKEVLFRARVHNIRKMSSKLVFFVFRQQLTTIQGVLQEHGNISSYFLYWAEHIDVEAVVLVKGVIQEPKAKQGEIIGTSIRNLEISVHELHVEAGLTESLPFTVHEGEITKAETEKEGDTRQRVGDRVRMVNRVIDLRTTASQGIFRIQAGMCNLFRTYLDTQGFIEIHTPKLQGGATESGASVFKIDYFGRPAFLAQSPQLAKQMSISADFRRVYEIGAVFRAENSNTHRHLTEYTGLDLEMAIDEHYHEVLDMLDNTFKFIFKGIYERYRHEIEIIKQQFPHEDLVWLEKTPRIPFKEAVQMLNETGWKNEKGESLPLDEDLGTRDEIQLGRVIKEKFGTDYYILDKFPRSARPFYTMPDPNDPTYTNSFDIFLRGQEILSGGQRIHDSTFLLKNMGKFKVDPRTMEEYVDGFEWGAPPHGGGGIGLERMLMLFLALGDIRHGSLFPRDPKSLPAKPPLKQLRHPEASTLHPPWQGKDRVTAMADFQPLEKLIANYGDASNTSWLEPRTQIWRDELTGAAVGWVPQDGFAITVGDPLCHLSQYTKTIAGFLRYIKKEKGLKPLWLLVGHEMEEVLSDKFNWRTFSVVAEQRLNPGDNHASHDPDVKRKIRHAEKEGVKIHDVDIGTPVPEDVKQKCDARIEDWLKGRKDSGRKQVHLTDLHPWQDMEHRQYHYAVDKNGSVCCMVVMAQLSADHGWQVKYSLDFPNAPSGAIEMIVMHALQQIAKSGATTCTFGGGASAEFRPGHNLKGTRVKVLSRAYHAIATELKLTNKSEFRMKLGAKEDPVYIAYPPHGLGPMGVRAIMQFFEDDD